VTAKDESQPSPHAQEPQNQGGETVAPKNQPQSDLFLRNLQDALNDPARSKDLERDSGYSREQLDQFIKEYKQVKSAPAGPGREINVKPGEQSKAQPSPNLPGLSPSMKFSSKNVRNRDALPQDDLHGHAEGIRFEPPAEWREKYEDYKNRLAKVSAPKRAANAASKTSP
jgi:hypothetical protein